MDREFSSCELVIQNLIKSFYPVIYITSLEELRTLRFFGDLTGEMNQHLITWDVMDSFNEYGVKGVYPHLDKLGMLVKPNLALEAMAKVKADQPDEEVIFIAKDLHMYMDQPDVIRALKRLSEDFKTSLKTLIILSPVVKIPQELERDIVVVNYDLMDRKDVRVFILNMFNRLSGVDAINDAKRKDAKGFKNYIETLTRSAIGLTEHEIENAVTKAIVKSKSITQIDSKDIYSEKARMFRKSPFAKFMCPDVTFEDLGGYDVFKGWIKSKSALLGFDALGFGAMLPKGVAIAGIEGVGKTTAVMAAANYLSVPIVKISLVEMGWCPETFIKALKDASPLIVWIDASQGMLLSNAVAFFKTLGDVQSSFNPYDVFVVLEGGVTDNDVVTYEDKIFEEVFVFGLPVAEERFAILRRLFIKKGRNPDDLTYNMGGDELKSKSEIMSCKDLAAAVDYAMFSSYLQGKDDIDHKDLCDALYMVRINVRMPDIKELCDNHNYILANTKGEAVIMKKEGAIDIGEQDIDRGTKQEKLPFHKIELSVEQRRTVDGRIKIIEAHSAMLDPHIVKQTEHLDVPGEILVDHVDTYKSPEELKQDFSPQQLKDMKEQFMKSR